MTGKGRQDDGLAKFTLIISIVLENGLDGLVEVLIITLSYERILIIYTKEYRAISLKGRIINRKGHVLNRGVVKRIELLFHNLLALIGDFWII